MCDIVSLVFVMPLVFNVCNGYSAGTGYLSWYLTDTQPSFSTVPKISRVILCLLLGLLNLRPDECICRCVCSEKRLGRRIGLGQYGK